MFESTKEVYSLKYFPNLFDHGLLVILMYRIILKLFFMFMFPFIALLFYSMSRASRHPQDLFSSLELCLFVVQHLNDNDYKLSNVPLVLN